MTKRDLFSLGLIVLVSSALSFFMLTRGQPWWDDFAAYLMQARAILAWDMPDFIEHNAFTIQNSSYPPGPVAYPWGYPLLLAPVVALFGLNTLALKLVGIAFYALFLVTFYLLAKTRLNQTLALLLTSVFACNPSLLQASDQIISDIPFLAVSTLSLWLIEHWSKKSPDFLTTLTLGASIFFATLLRTNGLLLLIPLIVARLVADWPDWKSALKRALLPLTVFSILFTSANLIFPNGQDSYLSHFSMFNLPRLWENFLFYLWLPSRTFEQLPLGVIFYPLLAIFLLFSVFAHWKRDLALHAYSLATLGLFILWPERQGLRFIFPLLPLLFISAANGLELALSHLPIRWQNPASRAITGFWSLLILLSLGASANLAYLNLRGDRTINGPFDTVSYELYAFIREKTPANSVIIFVRPRALRLFTGRDAFMTTRCADLSKGDYIALHEKMSDNGQLAPEQISTCPGITLASVFNNKRFTVYKINP